MPDPAGQVVAAIVLVTALVLLALLAAAFEAALTARTAGGPIPVAALSPVTEVARLLRQRRRTLLAADRPLWRTATAGLVLTPLLMATLIPVGSSALLDTEVSLVGFNAADIVVWALVWLLGWGANSSFALIGGYRFLAQALAYELPLMFALTAPAVAARSLRLTDVVAAQHHLWYVTWMPIAFVVFLIGVAGFSVWGPLGPAAAPDLVGGVLAELSGPDRLLAQAGRYLLLTAGAAFAVVLFLGGGDGPLLPAAGWLVVKTALVLAGLVLLGRRLPLLRPERFMSVGWLILLPATLLQLLVVSIVAVVTAGGR